MTPLDVVARDDARGMTSLLRELGRDPLPAAALLLLAARRRLIVATGFPIDGRVETDGPPGAVALLRALAALGCGDGLAIASWRAVLDLVDADLPGEVERIALPLPPGRCPRLQGAGIAVEACGTTPDGRRLDMRGRDVAGSSPCFEDALGDEILVAVGDGGNEVGMGSAPESWARARGIERPRSTASVLVPATVSNWGALAIVATLSALTRCELLPAPDEHARRVERMVAAGAVDGVTGRPEPTVDGRPLQEELDVLVALRALAAR